MYSDVGDESKIHFVFYTSAPKKNIDTTQIEKIFREQFPDSSAIELDIFFAEDITDEISDAVFAFSIKKLYAEHGKTLLAHNFRYYVKGKTEKTVDDDISKTIKENPASFRLKNNGITIICDSFDIDGNIVKLRNFSIVNGGQTTYQLHKSKNLDAKHDFWLPCKIIKVIGRNNFDLKLPC
mgnify:CR=1 FL=1